MDFSVSLQFLKGLHSTLHGKLHSIFEQSETLYTLICQNPHQSRTHQRLSLIIPQQLRLPIIIFIPEPLDYLR
jgi:hypothetical protein